MLHTSLTFCASCSGTRSDAVHALPRQSDN
jgi:hypothetical protein